MTPAPAPRILVADDQPDILEALRLLLKGEGYAIETAASPAAVMAALETRDFATALIDLNYARDTTSGQEGLDLLQRIQALDPSLPVIVMTAWASIELAVEAMRRGARDFIQKPWENARLLAIVRTQVELGQALRRTNRLEAELGPPARGGQGQAHRRVEGDAARAGDDRARGPLGRQRAHHAGRTARAREPWPTPCTRCRCGRRGPWRW